MTRAFSATLEQVSRAPDKYELTIDLSQDHNTDLLFQVEMNENQARRLLIDIVHEVGVPGEFEE